MVIRIWYGPEAEGFEKGKQTAFIEAKELNREDLIFLTRYIIPEYLEPNGIKRLYFGANERDLKYIEGGFFEALTEDYEILIETSPDNLNSLISKTPENARIILRNIIALPDEKMLEIDYKFRTKTGIVLLREKAFTSMSDIQDGIYGCDTLVYSL